MLRICKEGFHPGDFVCEYEASGRKFTGVRLVMGNILTVQ